MMLDMAAIGNTYGAVLGFVMLYILLEFFDDWGCLIDQLFHKINLWRKTNISRVNCNVEHLVLPPQQEKCHCFQMG